MPQRKVKSAIENQKLSDQEKQGMAVEYELMRQEVAEIDRQIQELQLKQVEMLAIRQGIDAIKDGRSKDMLVPLGIGVYINSQLTNKQTVLINVGAGVVVEKNFDEAAKLIDLQIESVNGMITDLDSHAEQFVNQMHEIETSLSA